MLNSKFLFKKEFLENQQLVEELNKEIDKAGLKKKNVDVEMLVGEEKWRQLLKSDDLAKLTCIVSDYGVVNIEVDGLKGDFKYDNVKKRAFLVDLSEFWTADITISTAVNALERVESIEVEYDKSVLDFNEEEMRKTIVALFEEMKYHRLRARLNVISRLQDFYFCTTNDEPLHLWASLKSVKALREILSNTSIKEDSLSKKDLINLSRMMPNAQDSVIPLLIFEGVRLSKNEELDELRYLEKKDLSQDNVLTIKGKDGENGVYKREIQLSNDVANVVRNASNESFISATMHGKTRYLELNDTKYILRPSMFGKKKVTNTESESISFRGAYGRVLSCKETFESVMYDVPFSPKSIEKFGKVYYVNKLVNEGYALSEALKQTVIRFGAWKKVEEGVSEKEKENINAMNYQSVTRLKAIWQVYN